MLYRQLVRDLLLSLAARGLYHARWSVDINDAWTRNFAAKLPASADRIPAIVEVISAAIPESLVTGYRPLIAGLELPDKDDRHVLAAAIAGHADCIVTFNLKDFPAEVLARHGTTSRRCIPMNSS